MALTMTSAADAARKLIDFGEKALTKAQAQPAQAAAVVLAATGGVAVLTSLWRRWSKERSAAAPSLLQLNTHAAESGKLADSYTAMFDANVDDEARKAKAQGMVAAYYALVTDMFENGWSDSFHFATRWPHETLQDSLARHEYYLAARVGLKHGMHALDVGCGVGGPARNIARFTGAKITGVTISDYQIGRGAAKNAAEGLSHLVNMQVCDFMALTKTFAPGTFDAAYAIEATCHAPDRTKCFTEVFKTLKPGAVFGGYEWVMTDKYVPGKPEHETIKAQVMVGDGLPYISGADDVRNALKAAGFVIEELRDLAPASRVPWYQPFLHNYTSREGLRTSPLVLSIVHAALVVSETLGMVPRGTALTHHNLLEAVKGLRAGGQQDIFTPMLFFLARKPAASV